MKPPQWLMAQFDNGADITVLDLRAPAAYEKGHIEGAFNILLKDLPGMVHTFDRNKPIICACNGSVQSAYAIMFLHTRGFNSVHNLSGGMSRWEKEGYPLVHSS